MYSGPPTSQGGGSHGGFGGYVKKPDAQGNWRDPSGIMRDAEGAIVTPNSGVPMRGPEYSSRHLDDGKLMDRIVETFNKE
jgi:hypothetical protein